MNPRTQEDLCEFKTSQGYIASLGQEGCIVRFCLIIGLIKKKKERKDRKKEKKPKEKALSRLCSGFCVL